MREQVSYTSGYATATVASKPISLQSMIDRLLRHSLIDIVRESDSKIVNEVPAECILLADENKVVPVIEELIAAVVSNSRKGKIHITADRFRDIIILEIQDRSNYNGYALHYRIRSLEPLARKIDGHLTIRGEQRLETAISLSFPNLAVA